MEETNLIRKSSKADKKTSFSRDELLAFSKEDLADHVLRLQASNVQLRNLMKKQIGDDSSNSTKSSSSNPQKREFDFTKHCKRHILLRILYLGWDYQGYATQEDTINTIEYHLFAALQKSCLVEDRQTSNYHRCGRTDKGVSSYGQVISIDVRSKLKEDYSLDSDPSKELPYCKILNRLLPSEIRAVAWRPAPSDFSARFDCVQRTYKYYFPKGSLNLDAMRKAAQYVMGTHDFRNLCKMDVGNGVVNYVREIRSICIEDFKGSVSQNNSKFDMMVLTLVGTAFLWHQVRCLVAILLLVGQGYEEPEVMLKLLDIETNPRKPQYSMASEVPLNLFHCQYSFDDSLWLVDEETISEVESSLQRIWTFSSVKTVMLMDMLNQISSLKTEGISNFDTSQALLQGVKSKIYKPLLERQTCESLESRIQHYSKRRRLDDCNDESTSRAEFNEEKTK
ncbi:tRNA pseudouridine(38/39) synthase [Frankliniella fusca]|uniref:tRNA pseudouridine(38/39) synthase n=1 Tax=Frankliniella fusca TaxID=407009 RepID=A0AAE1HHD4_9NEOP|nr:tRNA pseudouridine(38/39) synthase [Frankliniella fusca]